MASISYESALEIARSLSGEEQLRLVRELSYQKPSLLDKAKPASILDLCGLGSEIWQQMDAQEYVRGERSIWGG